MSLIAPIALLAAAAVITFPLRKRVDAAAIVSLSAVLLAFAAMSGFPEARRDTLLDLELELSGLARLASMLLLATLALLLVYVWLAEPAYNFFPSALGVGAAALASLLLRDTLAIYVALLVGLLIPVGTFTFHVHANRSVEAALRHFGFVTLGGSLGLAALALAAGLPREHPEETFILLIVIVFVAFALKLAAIPFHTHAALLAGEAPTPALALYFGVLVPVTFIAFPRILTLSGLLPAIVQVGRVQELALLIGLASAVGGALLASGAPDLRRLVVYSVISNLGAALVGIGTLSGPGIVGGIAIVLVTGAAATQQLLAAGTLERRAAPARPGAAHAPLAAAAFVAGAIGMIGAPPLIGFPGHFFVELIAYTVNPAVGIALLGSTLLLLIAQLRAGISLFERSVDVWHVEPRPIAGAIGALILIAMLIGGIVPNAFLHPIAQFADEVIRALRPL